MREEEVEEEEAGRREKEGAEVSAVFISAQNVLCCW